MTTELDAEAAQWQESAQGYCCLPDKRHRGHTTRSSTNARGKKRHPLVNLSLTIVMSCVFHSSLSNFISFSGFCSYLYWCLPLEFSSIRSTGADLRGHIIVIKVCLSIFGSPKMQTPNIMGHTGSSVGYPTHPRCGISKGAKALNWLSLRCAYVQHYLKQLTDSRAGYF